MKSFTDREGNRTERTEWHRVVVFQRQAEICCQYLHKGSLVYVEGRITTQKWQDQNGQDRYNTEIRADKVIFLDKKNADDVSYGSSQAIHFQHSNAGHEDMLPAFSDKASVTSQSQNQPHAGAAKSETPLNAGKDDMDEMPF